jgi:hypothetical protein
LPRRSASRSGWCFSSVSCRAPGTPPSSDCGRGFAAARVLVMARVATLRVWMCRNLRNCANPVLP